MEFRDIEVIEIKQETEDTCTFYFAPPSESFDFIAGQYITISTINRDEEVRRAYSICTSPLEDKIGFTVKRVKGGIVSNFLHDQIKIGDTLKIASPEGKFVIDMETEIAYDLYFIAAGSGITPVMSMLKTVLEEHPLSTCYLLYGSRNEDQIIFAEALQVLQKKYTDQLYVMHTLSKPKKESSGGIGGLFKKSKISWFGEVGRIDNNKVKDFLGKYPSRSRRDAYYLCGPGDMIENTEGYLTSLGVEKKDINAEYFSTKTESVTDSAGGVVHVTLHKKVHDITVNPDETVLEAALREGLDAPYSCTSGACSSCLAKVSHGEIEMDACYALEDDEVEAGYILTCQSRLQSPSAEINYDV